MLIKLYARGATPHLHIIENVSQVQVDSRTTSRAVFTMGEEMTPTSYEHLEFDDEDCRLILCRHEDKNKGILVYNHAYICTDEGKTIEKVFV